MYFFFKIYTKKYMYMPYTYKFNFIDLLLKKICTLSSQRENSLRIVYEHIQNDTILKTIFVCYRFNFSSCDIFI